VSEPRFNLRAGGVPEITLDATSEVVEYQLPAGFASGRRLIVRREDSSIYTATATVVSGGVIDGVTNGTRVIPRNGEVEFDCKGGNVWETYGGSSGGSVPEDVEGLLDLKADRDLANIQVIPALAKLGIEEGGRRPVGTETGTVASGDDPRFTDARTPTAHASTHGLGGPDVITVQQAQVAGLVAALAATVQLVGGKIPTEYLPQLVVSTVDPPNVVESQAEMLALDVGVGAVAVRTDEGKTYILRDDPTVLADWLEIVATGVVTSVAGKSGTVALTLADVQGLVDALAGKADASALAGYATVDFANVTPATGRAALQLGNSSTRNVGTTAGTVATGDDARIVGAATQVGLDAVSDVADEALGLAEDAIPLAYIGAPDGVSPLDGAGIVPVERIGLSAADVGAATVLHSHGLSELPDAGRVLGTALLVVTYDEDAEQWSSTRAALVLRPGQRVLWWGNAEPPSDADADDLHFFDAAAVPLPPVEEPDPPAAVRDANGVLLNVPTVTVTGQTANVSALLNTNASRTFTYLQFALRRATDQASADTGHTNNLTVNGDYTLTASKSALGAGDWTAQLAYSLDGVSWFNGPTVAFEVEAPISAPTPMTVGARSGLPWNGGVFYQAGSLTAANSFATWRGRPLDAIMYFTGRDKWSDLMWFRDDLTSFPGYRVICVPFQPQIRNSQGQFNAEGSNNIPTASGSNNHRWTTWAQALKAKGWDDGRTIVRLSWENNGNWYDWGWGNTVQYASAATAISAFTGAWINVVDTIRAVAPTLLFDCNVNRGNTRSGVNFFTDILAPIIDHVDIIGLDWYNHAPAQLSQGEFDSTANQTYSGNDIHAWCVSNDKYLSIDEWFPSQGQPPSYYGGGDDAGWIARMWTWMNGKAVGNGGRLIQEISYNDPGAPSTLQHSLYNPEQNPNAAAAYKSTSRWGRA
jgi:hypothetical protein